MYDKISTHHQTVFLSTILNNDQAVCHWHLCAKEPFGLRFTICYLVEQGGEGTMVYALSFGKGLFINDVIIFGGYRDPPPPPRHHSSLFGYPPSHVRVTRDKTDFATKQRMLAS